MADRHGEKKRADKNRQPETGDSLTSRKPAYKFHKATPVYWAKLLYRKVYSVPVKATYLARLVRDVGVGLSRGEDDNLRYLHMLGPVGDPENCFGDIVGS